MHATAGALVVGGAAATRAASGAPLGGGAPRLMAPRAASPLIVALLAARVGGNPFCPPSAVPHPPASALPVARTAFGFLVRNGAGYLKTNLCRIQALGRVMGEYRISYTENDSKDHTRAILDAFERDDPYIRGEQRDTGGADSHNICPSDDYNCNARVAIIARLRNRVLDMMLAWAEAQFLMMLDLDFIDFSEHQFWTLYTIKHEKNADGVFPMSVTDTHCHCPYDTGAVGPYERIEQISAWCQVSEAKRDCGSPSRPFTSLHFTSHFTSLHSTPLHSTSLHFTHFISGHGGRLGILRLRVVRRQRGAAHGGALQPNRRGGHRAPPLQPVPPPQVRHALLPPDLRRRLVRGQVGRLRAQLRLVPVHAALAAAALDHHSLPTALRAGADGHGA